MDTIESGIAKIESRRDDFPMTCRPLSELLIDVSHATIQRHAAMLGMKAEGRARPYTADEAIAVWESFCTRKRKDAKPARTGYYRVTFTLTKDEYVPLIKEATKRERSINWLARRWVLMVLKKKRAKEPLF